MPAPDPRLKPCPFCGAVPSPFDGDLHFMHFNNCFVTLLTGANEQWIVGERRIATWNHRVEEKPH